MTDRNPVRAVFPSDDHFGPRDHRSHQSCERLEAGADRNRRRLRAPVLVLAASLAAVLVPAAARASVTFAPALSTATAIKPVNVAVGDVNGDGKQDVAITDAYTAEVLSGDGHGAFGNPQKIAMGYAPHSVALADLNGDGHLDLITADAGAPRPGVGANCLVVRLGDGKGGFGLEHTFSLGPVEEGPTGIAVVDLNRDGVRDVVVSENNTNEVSVFLGDGRGGFRPAVHDAVAVQPSGVAVGDFNGDGIPDLATPNSGPTGLGVIRYGDGTGAFPTRSGFTAPGASAIAAGDVNGSGRPDFATGNYAAQNVSIFDPYAHTVHTLPIGPGDALPGDIVIGDLTGDGRGDVVTTDSGTAKVSVIESSPTGPQPAVSFAVGADPLGVAIADLNGDGRPDVVVGAAGARQLSVLLNTTATPRSQTGPAHVTGKGTAVLTGTVDPHGSDTHYHFSYGTTSAYGASTPSVDAGSTSGAQSVSATLGSLTPGLTYHYRLVASNSAGTVVGVDRTVVAGP